MTSFCVSYFDIFVVFVKQKYDEIFIEGMDLVLRIFMTELWQYMERIACHIITKSDFGAKQFKCSRNSIRNDSKCRRFCVG